MNETPTKIEPREQEIEHIMTSPIAESVAGLSNKDKALVGAVSAVIIGVLTWLNQGVQQDMNDLKTSNAVLIEKITKIETGMSERYTRSQAAADWSRQATIDEAQTAALKDLTSLLREHERTKHGP